MSLNPTKMIAYLKSKYNIKVDESKFIQLIEHYNNPIRCDLKHGELCYSDKPRKLINMIFSTLFGLSLESLNTLSNEKSTEYNDVDSTIKELSKSINKLSNEIKDLKIINEELKDNYWKLNQSIINK
jgi:hypothetical protein